MPSPRKFQNVSESEESDAFVKWKKKDKKGKPEKPEKYKNEQSPPSPSKKRKRNESEENSSEKKQKRLREVDACASDNSDSIIGVKQERIVDPEGTLLLEDITSDDEIYTLQVPDNFEIESLLKKTIDLSYLSAVKDQKSKKYFDVSCLENDKKLMTCALPSKVKEAGLVSLPVSGHIIVKRRVNLDPPVFSNSIKKEIVFPADIKLRHPLLGLDWQECNFSTPKGKKKKR